jgi:Mce-associated membrane protein
VTPDVSQDPAVDTVSNRARTEGTGSGGRLRRGLSDRTRAIIAAVLVLVILAGAAVTAVLVSKRADIESRLDARRTVAQVAERFTVQFNTYQPDDVDGYTESVQQMLSTSAKQAFDNRLSDITKLITSTKLESDGQVLASGVSSLDQDSAEVLVVADAQTDSTAGATQRHFRWEISLVQVDGTWLVDDFSPVS